MAMCRLNNAEFHKFLSEFSEEVSKGRYRKMPYDKYRTFRSWHDTSVDVVLEHYTNLNGSTVQRIRISPDGPTGYEFYIDDGSFGSFCNDYLKAKKEEPKVHPDEKKITYDIFGNATMSTDTETYCKCSDDPTVKQALHDYYVSNALNSTSTSISADKVSTSVTIAGDSLSWAGDIGWSNVSTDVHTEIKTLAEVAREEADCAREEANRANTRIDILDSKVHNEMAMRLHDVAEKCAADLKELRDEIYAKLATKQDITFEYNLDGVMTQSTSSNVYPVKNYKLDLKADYMSGSDSRKENENMDTNKMFNFDFGPVASNIRMSPYGMAMKNADGKYVSYDKTSGNIMDVEILNFDAQKFLYKMPVAVSAVAVGDIVVHMRKAMFVSAVNGNRISVVDIYNGEVKDIMPTTSPFGFNFITKVVSLIDMTGADANAPFGNMLPFLMMGEGRDFKDILPLMLLSNGNTNFTQNPLMLYALMGDGNMNDMLPFLFMMGNNPFAPASNCGCPTHADHSNCDGNCHQ